jgi:transcription elongation factor GreB
VLEVRYERISVEPFREPPGSEASVKGLPRGRSPDEEETSATPANASVPRKLT